MSVVTSSDCHKLAWSSHGVLHRSDNSSNYELCRGFESLMACQTERYCGNAWHMIGMMRLNPKTMMKKKCLQQNVIDKLLEIPFWHNEVVKSYINWWGHPRHAFKKAANVDDVIEELTLYHDPCTQTKCVSDNMVVDSETAAVEKFIESLLPKPYKTHQPSWEVYLINLHPKCDSGKCESVPIQMTQFVLLRMHHALCDGQGLVKHLSDIVASPDMPISCGCNDPMPIIKLKSSISSPASTSPATAVTTTATSPTSTESTVAVFNLPIEKTTVESSSDEINSVENISSTINNDESILNLEAEKAQNKSPSTNVHSLTTLYASSNSDFSQTVESDLGSIEGNGCESTSNLLNESMSKTEACKQDSITNATTITHIDAHTLNLFSYMLTIFVTICHVSRHIYRQIISCCLRAVETAYFLSYTWMFWSYQDSETPITPYGKSLGRRSVRILGPLSLSEIKSVGRPHNASVNDVLMTVASGAVRRYLLYHCDDKPSKEFMNSKSLRMSVYIARNLRHLYGPSRSVGGISSGIYRVPLSMYEHNPIRRLKRISKHGRWLKSPLGTYCQKYYTDLLEKILYHMSFFIWMLAKTCSGFYYSRVRSCVGMTNLFGLQEGIRFACHEVDQLLALVNNSQTFSVMSYDGAMFISTVSEDELVDPDTFRRCFMEEYEYMVKGLGSASVQ